jgi:hypothetical protein
LLSKRVGIWRAQNSGDFWQRLIIFNDATDPTKLMANEMAYQLDESLPVAQDSGFQSIAQDGIGNDQR